MVAAWFGYCLLVSLLLTGAAILADNGLSVRRRPVRWAWAVAMLASLALPAAALLLPREIAPGAAPFPPGLPTAMGIAGPAPAQGLPLDPAVRLGYLDGPLAAAWIVSILLFVGFVSLSALRLRRERSRWLDGQIRGRPVAMSPDTGPAVVGLLRGTIVMPQWISEIEEDLVRLVFLHEEEHRVAGDQRLHALGLLCLAAMPWNPFAWWQLRRLRLAIEFDCDRRVLGRGVSAHRYGEAMLTVGSQISRAPLAAAAFAEPASELERRVRRLADDRRGGKRLRVASAAAMAMALIALACQAPVPPVPADEDQLAPPAASVSAGERAAAEITVPGRDGKDVTITVRGIEQESLDKLEAEGLVVGDVRDIDGDGDLDIKLRPVGEDDSFYVSGDRLIVEGPGDRPVKLRPTMEADGLPPDPSLLPDQSADVDPASITRKLKIDDADPANDVRFGDEGSEPLIVIDGEIKGRGTSSMRGLDKSRIDRIEVIKGEAAVTIYGERGNNGVIQIYTKDAPEIDDDTGG